MTFQNGVDGVPPDDGLLLVAHGELDAATADECFTEMAEPIEKCWRTMSIPASVVIGPGAVRLLSCAGVRVALRLARCGARAGVPVGVTVPDDGPVRRVIDVPAVRSSVPVVACPAPVVHDAGHQPRECRFSGAHVTDQWRTSGGPGAHRGISPEAAHRPYVSGGATRFRQPGQASDPENAPGHRRPSEIRTRPPTNA